MSIQTELPPIIGERLNPSLSMVLKHIDTGVDDHTFIVLDLESNILGVSSESDTDTGSEVQAIKQTWTG